MRNRPAEAAGKSLEAILEERKRANPAGRFGDPHEFGEACAFLCSAQAGTSLGKICYWMAAHFLGPSE